MFFEGALKILGIKEHCFNIFKTFLGPVDVAIKKYDFHLSDIRMADRWLRLMIMHKKAHDNALDSFF